MEFIELKKLWTDDDGMLQVELVASNGHQVGRQDFYAYPEQLEKFGKSLSSFPSAITDIVTFEYGEKDNFYSHVILTAQMFSNSGPASIKVELDNNFEPPNKAFSMFYISADPASINDFGRSLIAWSKDDEEVLRAEFIV